MDQFAAIVLGAFLAGVFGLIGSIVIWHYQKKKEQKVIMKTLYAELTNLKKLLQSFQMGIDQRIVKPGVPVRITFLKYNTYAVERQNLYSFMPRDEMQALESVYHNFAEYDALLGEAPFKNNKNLPDQTMLFWNYYQDQREDNIKNIDRCLQYLENQI